MAALIPNVNFIFIISLTKQNKTPRQKTRKNNLKIGAFIGAFISINLEQMEIR
jgi:hypothetical protein